MKSRRTMLLILLAALSHHCLAEVDAFDALDAELDAQFEAQDTSLEADYQALDEALEQAYERLAKEVGATWGEDDVELPSKVAWVDYSDDLSVRRKIDFEKGEVTIERLIDETDNIDEVVASIQQAAASIVVDSPADLATRDTALRYAKEALAEQDIALDDFVQAPAPEQDSSVLGSLGREMPAADRLGTLVASAISGDASSSSSAPAAVLPSTTATASVAPSKGNKKKVSVVVPLPMGFETTLAGRYQQAVAREARRQSLPVSLVFAVMETESHFNPRARSAVPAYGLMQLVPRSGAMDSYRHVYGEKVLLGPDYLYEAEQNVELGAGYLNLLDTRYLRAVTNDTSRLYCIIAAYNTGAGNVAKSFTGKTNVKKAAPMINALTPQQVYDHLVKHLPYEETRHYLQKVIKAKKKYAPLDRLAASPQTSIPRVLASVGLSSQ
jgi:membrane-bound lytic murein transglycosylase C